MMKKIDEGQPFHVITDYVHTLGGIEKTLQYARSITASDAKILGIFFADGKGTGLKQRLLARLAELYCDTVYLTQQEDELLLPDRATAIEMAVRKADTGDCVLILGMCREVGKFPWKTDNVAVKETLSRIKYEMDGYI